MIRDPRNMSSNLVTLSPIQRVQKRLPTFSKVGHHNLKPQRRLIKRRLLVLPCRSRPKVVRAPTLSPGAGPRLEVVALLNQRKHARRRLKPGLVLALLRVPKPKDTRCEIDFDVLEGAHRVNDLLFLRKVLGELADAHVLGGECQNSVIAGELAVQYVADNLLAVGGQFVGAGAGGGAVVGLAPEEGAGLDGCEVGLDRSVG